MFLKEHNLQQALSWESVTVGKNVFVGLNSTIKDGLSIGDEALLAQVQTS